MGSKRHTSMRQSTTRHTQVPCITLQSPPPREASLAVLHLLLQGNHPPQQPSSRSSHLACLNKASRHPPPCLVKQHLPSSFLPHLPSALACGPPHPSTCPVPETAQATSSPQLSTTKPCLALRSLRLFSLGFLFSSPGPHGPWGPPGPPRLLLVDPPCPPSRLLPLLLRCPCWQQHHTHSQAFPQPYYRHSWGPVRVCPAACFPEACAGLMGTRY